MHKHPAKRVWTKPVPIEDQDGPYVFTPLTAAGLARAYKKQPETNVWTLQLPRAEMPKARVPIEFVPPAGRNAENATPAFGGTESAQWFWTPHGYFVTVSPPFKTTTVYFIPQTELDAYLDAHIPGEDATGSAPPAPTKTAAPRS